MLILLLRAEHYPDAPRSTHLQQVVGHTLARSSSHAILRAGAAILGGHAVVVPRLVQALYQGVQAGERGVDAPVLPGMQLAIRPGLGVLWEQREELPGLHCSGAAA